MQGINYNDISTVYSGVYTQPQPPQMVDDEPADDFEDGFEINENDFENDDQEQEPIEPRQEGIPPEIIYRLMEQQDTRGTRDLLRFAGKAALGYAAINFLTKPARWLPSGNDDWSRGERLRTIREMRERGEIP